MARKTKKKAATKRRVKLVQGYDGVVLAYLLDDEGNQVREKRFVQRRNQRTITGVRDDRGILRVFNAKELKRFFRVSPKLESVRDEVVLDDDKGLFADYTAEELYIVEHKVRHR